MTSLSITVERDWRSPKAWGCLAPTGSEWIFATGDDVAVRLDDTSPTDG